MDLFHICIPCLYFYPKYFSRYMYTIELIDLFVNFFSPLTGINEREKDAKPSK